MRLGWVCDHSACDRSPLVSVGALTHSALAPDLGLDLRTG